jgi:alkane 1-monooxygenase
MKNTKWKYLAVYITPLVVIFSLYSENYWSYFSVLFVFGIIPFVELFTKKDQSNLSPLEEEKASKNSIYDWILFGLVPMQYGIFFYFLYQMSNDQISLFTKIGYTIALGISCGVLGINAAHELGHRTSKKEQLMSKLLLITSLYLHFFIEHNRGHHKNVSTDHDPASSKYGETVYAFYFRSIIMGWLSAWKLEQQKLMINHKKFWSWHNEMIRFQVYQLVFIILIIIFFGVQTTLFFMVAALIGILLLETVNYIEHYGLRRTKKGERYERTLPIHSWNSNHPIGRLLLLELSRHSDHHFIASRKYPLLRHHDESPQMPTGYPGMMLLTFIPPLWFYVMHKKINAISS